MSTDGETRTAHDGSGGGWRLTRRQLLGAGALGGASLALPRAAEATAPRVEVRSRERDDGADLVLVNGRIHTMDGGRDSRWSIVSAVAVEDGRVVAVGDEVRRRRRGARVIDLGGRTVVPGLVETHTHVLLMGLRPGYHTPLENAYSIADVQEILAARREGRNRWSWWSGADAVPEDAWITSIGGFSPNTFAERRLPTRAELDDAVPDRPVFLFNGLLGPCATNSPGKAFFEAHGVPVGEDGSIRSGPESNRAAFLLYERRTFEDELRGHRDMMAYAATLGLTTNFDQGVFPKIRTPAGRPPGERTPADYTYLHEDEYRYDDAIFELDRRGELTVRVRLNYLHQEEDPNVPLLTARLDNLTPYWGNDMLEVIGIGEFTAGVSLFPVPTPAWVNGTRKVAEAGWRNENHGLIGTDVEAIVSGWEAVDTAVPIDDLRWVLAHAWGSDLDQWKRLEAMGCGINVTGGNGYQGDGTFPFRALWDSGVKAGFGADGPDVMPLNPWQNIAFAVTGRNVQGQLTNDGQQISRRQALRWYTSENGWFTREEDELGSIEPGKRADLVVLNRDYFAVPDDELDRLHSVLTIVGGRIVHDRGAVGP